MKRHRYKKHYRIRKKKSIFRKWSFWLTFLILVLFSSGFYFFIFSSTFQVKEIKVTGEIKIPVEELKNAISDKVNKKIAFFNIRNIFLANTREIDKILLEKFPQIAKVQILREFPDVLAAQIEERKPFALFLRGENYFYIDKTGVIFEEVFEIPQLLKIKLASIPDLELGKRIIEEEKMTQILKIISKLNDLKIPIEEILIASERRFNAKTLASFEIYFNPEKDLDWQLTELSILLKERIPPEKRGKLQYIDLRFEKIYIYPENY